MQKNNYEINKKKVFIESKQNGKVLSRKLQEKNYFFPYHYIVNFDVDTCTDFSQFKNNPGGYRYASYLIKIIEILENEDFKKLEELDLRKNTIGAYVTKRSS